MTPDIRNKRLKQLVRSGVGLALLWAVTPSATLYAQDSHAGHDPAEPADQAHADGDPEVHPDEADHDQHGADEGHGAPHEEAEHADDPKDGHETVTDEHGEEEEEGLRLTPEQRRRFGIVIQTAGPGTLAHTISLPGEIVFNQDRMVHLVPRVAGIAREVFKSVGDTVDADEVLAVIDSRELADAKSEYLAAQARGVLAEKTFVREKALREKQVSSEQDYLEAEQILAEARIEMRSAEQKLHALGLTKRDVARLDSEPDEAITRYEIRSPIAGIVTEKHVSLGESLAADADVFTVVDLGSVWVNLTVHMKNLGAVKPKQAVTVRMDHSGAHARGEVSMVTPFAEESTRSATARVVLDNSGGAWMPGTFVTGFINTSEANLPVVTPKHAVQNIEGRDVVFVEHAGLFEMNPVTVGRADRTHVEIVAGLEPGTPYVAEGAYPLKATVITRALGSHAGHGH